MGIRDREFLKLARSVRRYPNAANYNVLPGLHDDAIIFIEMSTGLYIVFYRRPDLCIRYSLLDGNNIEVARQLAEQIATELEQYCAWLAAANRHFVFVAEGPTLKPNARDRAADRARDLNAGIRNFLIKRTVPGEVPTLPTMDGHGWEWNRNVPTLAGHGWEWNRSRRQLCRGVGRPEQEFTQLICKILAERERDVIFNGTIENDIIIDHAAKELKQASVPGASVRQVVCLSTDHDFICLAENIDAIIDPRFKYRSITHKADLLAASGLATDKELFMAYALADCENIRPAPGMSTWQMSRSVFLPGGLHNMEAAGYPADVRQEVIGLAHAFAWYGTHLNLINRVNPNSPVPALPGTFCSIDTYICNLCKQYCP